MMLRHFITWLLIALFFTFTHGVIQAETSTFVHGTVLQPDGKPAEKATVAMATFQNNMFINTGGKVRVYGEQQPVTTSKEGQFKFPRIDFEAEAKGRFRPVPRLKIINFILLVEHDTGFKYITEQDWNILDEKKTVTLEPWGRIEGTVKQETQPGKRLPVQCSVIFRKDRVFPRVEPFVYADYDTTADESGRFVFDRVPPSWVEVGRTIFYNGRFEKISHATDEFLLKPGEIQKITLGGVGRPVIGKLVPSDEFETVPDWKYSHVECVPRYEVNRKHLRVCAVAEDGTFRLDDIFEGDWELIAYLDAPLPDGDSNRTRKCLGELKHYFTVATVPNNVSDEPKYLGNLTVIPPKPL